MNNNVKKYIYQEEWIARLNEELKTTKSEERRKYLKVWINSIKCQPTVDEKEIIRKAMEHTKAKLDEELMKIDKKRLRNIYSDEELLEVRGFEMGIRYAYICMREECGLSEANS